MNDHSIDPLRSTDQIEAAQSATREHLEGLTRMLRDVEAGARAAQSTRVRASSYRKAHTALEKVKRSVERARRDAIDDFAKPRGWRLESARYIVLGHGLGVAELHDYSLSHTWCDDCGGLCRATKDNCLHTDHHEGERDALCLRRGYIGRTEGVIQHTDHPFVSCQLFAAIFGLNVVQLDWSWYGRRTAALFTRAAQTSRRRRP